MRGGGSIQGGNIKAMCGQGAWKKDGSVGLVHRDRLIRSQDKMRELALPNNT